MRSLLVTALAAGAFGMLSIPKAEARFYASDLMKGPSLVDQAACVTRTIRDRRPNGNVVVRRVQQCTPNVVVRPVRRAPCRTVQVRERRNGKIVVRSVNRC